MGTTQSTGKPAESVNPADLQKGFKTLSDITDAFDQYNYASINTYIDSTTLTDEQKRKFKEAIQKLNKIFNSPTTLQSGFTMENILQNVQNKKLKDEIDKIKTSELFSTYPQLGQSLTKSLDKFVDVNTKYRYYLYNYIHLNAFLPLIFDAMIRINNDMFTQMSYLVSVERKRTQNVMDTFNTLLDLSVKNDEGKELTEEMKEVIELRRQVEEYTKKIVANTQTQLEGIQKQSIDEMLKFIVESNESIKDLVMKKGPLPPPAQQPA